MKNNTQHCLVRLYYFNWLSYYVKLPLGAVNAPACFMQEATNLGRIQTLSSAPPISTLANLPPLRLGSKTDTPVQLSEQIVPASLCHVQCCQPHRILFRSQAVLLHLLGLGRLQLKRRRRHGRGFFRLRQRPQQATLRLQSTRVFWESQTSD